METTYDKELGMDQILDLGVRELKNYIRALNIHNKAGVAGSDLSNFTLNQAQTLAISHMDPRKTVVAEKKVKQVKKDSTANEKIAELNQLAELLGKVAGNSFSAEQINEIINEKIAEAMKNLPPKQIFIEYNAKKIDCTGMHYKAPLVFACLKARLNTALVGPAGSGKTYLVEQLSEKEELDYYPVAFNPMSSKSDILGLVDATGNFRASAFYKAFKHGGVYLADEFDASNAGIATILNAAVANRKCTFANAETIAAHKDFVFVAAMNTFGTGANMQYVGRNRLDAATLDRFAFIEIGYDKRIERTACGLNDDNAPTPFNLESGGKVSAEYWYNLVKQTRDKAEANKVNVIISPRASINGTKLAQMGVGETHLKDLFLKRGLSHADQQKIGLH